LHRPTMLAFSLSILLSVFDLARLVLGLDVTDEL